MKSSARQKQFSAHDLKETLNLPSEVPGKKSLQRKCSCIPRPDYFASIFILA